MAYQGQPQPEGLAQCASAKAELCAHPGAGREPWAAHPAVLPSPPRGNCCPLHLRTDLAVAMGKVLNSSFWWLFFLIMMIFNSYSHVEELSFATSGHKDT